MFEYQAQVSGVRNFLMPISGSLVRSVPDDELTFYFSFDVGFLVFRRHPVKVQNMHMRLYSVRR